MSSCLWVDYHTCIALIPTRSAPSQGLFWHILWTVHWDPLGWHQGRGQLHAWRAALYGRTTKELLVELSGGAPVAYPLLRLLSLPYQARYTWQWPSGSGIQRIGTYWILNRIGQALFGSSFHRDSWLWPRQKFREFLLELFLKHRKFIPLYKSRQYHSFL